jgi:hypothetical protein
MHGRDLHQERSGVRDCFRPFRAFYGPLKPGCGWLSPGCGLFQEAIHKAEQAHGNHNRTHGKRHCNQVYQHEVSISEASVTASVPGRCSTRALTER